MDGVNNQQVGKPVTFTNQYGTWKIWNVTDSLRDKTADTSKVNLSDTAAFRKYEKPSTQLRAEQSAIYSTTALLRNPATSEAWQQISAAMNSAVSAYYDGELSDEALAGKVQTFAEQLKDACGQAGYPNILAANDRNSQQAMTDAVYSEFRMRLLSEAVKRNNAEGARHTSGEWDAYQNSMRTYKYYNSDYYYKSEAAISAISEGVQAYAREKGWDDFQIRDYQAEGLNMYANFNTAFSNDFNVDEKWIIDPNAVPPENFEWFYETGGSRDNLGVVTSIYSENPDGSRTYSYIRGQEGFDPADPCTGRTWAAYTDKSGQRHEVSADFYLDQSKADLKNVATLLNFTGGGEEANGFLRNLQLYPKNYFSNLLARSNLNIQA